MQAGENVPDVRTSNRVPGYLEEEGVVGSKQKMFGRALLVKETETVVTGESEQ